MGEAVATRVSGVLCAGLLLLAACGGDKEDGSADTTQPAVTGQPATSTVTTSTVASTTSASLGTGDSIFNEKVKLSERFMEPVRGWRRAWVACMTDIAACDYDAMIGPYVSGAVKDGQRETIDDLKAQGHNLRDSDPEGVRFVQYQVTRDSPLQVGLEVCVVLDGRFVTVAPDGTETNVDDVEPSEAQLTALVLEEQPDGKLTIDQSVEYGPDKNIKAENCDQYDKLPSSQ